MDWTNFDASPTLRLERVPLAGRLIRRNDSPFPANVKYGDVVRGLPVPEASCGLLYCSHVLEHLNLRDADLALKNSLRVLAPGGVWRMVVPDLRSLAERYIASDGPLAAGRFLRDTGLGVAAGPKGAVERIASVFGNARHLWMWDYESLSSRLCSVGFVDIRPAVLGDSEISAFAQVEQEERWTGNLGVECRVAW